MEIYEQLVNGKQDGQDIETNIKETLEAILADHEGLNREDIEEFIKDKAEDMYGEDLDEDGMQVNDIPSKNDQDHRHKRIELAKLESEDKTTYRVSYLNEDDDELVGWDIDAKDDDEAN